LQELVDTGLDEEEVAAIRATLLATPGVRSLHDLRTRKMADNALVDAHIIVDPKVSVSEGHYIAEAARNAVLSGHHVLDVMVHIDPEDDMQAKPNVHLPNREALQQQLAEALAMPELLQQRLVFHYLDGRIDAEIYLVADFAHAAALQNQCDQLTQSHAVFRSIAVACAQK
ncbi:MAG: cation transporter dimerization domain-containing protein, partial [Gallionella sp.]